MVAQRAPVALQPLRAQPLASETTRGRSLPIPPSDAIGAARKAGARIVLTSGMIRGGHPGVGQAKAMACVTFTNTDNVVLRATLPFPLRGVLRLIPRRITAKSLPE